MAGPSRYCYNWDFLNNTGAEATGLVVRLQGVKAVAEVYTGSANPFGAPDAGSGYDGGTGVYTLSFSGGPANAGDTVHIGFCADVPLLRASDNPSLPPFFWKSGTDRIEPAPIFVGVRWTWAGPTSVQIDLFNDGPADLTIMSVNLYDPDQSLALEDLVPGVVDGLSLIDELITEPELLPAGSLAASGRALVAVGSAGIASPSAIPVFGGNHPLVLEVVAAAADDPGNVAHIYVQALTPTQVYLPIILR